MSLRPSGVGLPCMGESTEDGVSRGTVLGLPWWGLGSCVCWCTATGAQADPRDHCDAGWRLPFLAPASPVHAQEMDGWALWETNEKAHKAPPTSEGALKEP